MRAAVQAVRAGRARPDRRRRAVAARTCARGCAPRPTRSSASITPGPFHAVGVWYDGLLPDDRRRGARAARARRRRPAAAPDGPRRRCAPLPGRGRRLRPADRARIGARFVLLGEASHGTHEFYRERARDHAAADRRGAASRRSRSRPTGPTPTASTAIVAGRATTPSAEEALATSGASRPGCGATPRWSSSSSGCASTTTRCRRRPEGRLLRPGPLQPARVDGGGGRLPGAGRPRGGAARARALRLLRPLRRRPAGLRLRGRDRRGGVVRAAGGRAAGRARRMARRRGAARRARRRGRALLRRAERAARGERRGVLPLDVPRRRRSWNLRDRHMAETLDALVAHLERTSGPAKVVVWAHNSHLGDARATEMGRRAS